MCAASVPRHGEAFDTPMDFRMGSWKEDGQFEQDALDRFPELRQCRENRHVVMNFRMAFPTGDVRTVGCWKCHTCVYKGKVVTMKEAFGPYWTGA